MSIQNGIGNLEKIASVVGADRVIQFWDVAEARKTTSIETGEKLFTVSYPGLLSVSSVCFSPDGKIVASAIHEETIKLWDVRSGRQLAALRGHESKVRSICFSPDGTTLASVGFEGMVRQWDMAAYASVPQTREGVERFTGGRFDEYEITPLPLYVYLSARPQHLTAFDHLKWEPAEDSPVEPNSFLIRHWLNQNASGWLRAAWGGAVKAMYNFALVQESQGNFAGAREQLQEATKKKADAQDPWAAKCRHRLRTIPWLLPRFETYARAVRCFEKGDFHGGMAAHRRASRAYHIDRARLQTELATYLTDRAARHLSQRALKWAERECRLAMELGGESHAQHFALAQILEARRELSGAKAHYEKAVSLAPPGDVVGQKAAQALARMTNAQSQ